MEKASKIKSFPLRVNEEVRNWYQIEAHKNKRSLNSEFVQALDENMAAKRVTKGEQ